MVGHAARAGDRRKLNRLPTSQEYVFIQKVVGGLKSSFRNIFGITVHQELFNLN